MSYNQPKLYSQIMFAQLCNLFIKFIPPLPKQLTGQGGDTGVCRGTKRDHSITVSIIIDRLTPMETMERAGLGGGPPLVICVI